ncbi:SirA family protein [Escherichia coli]|uniref:SirA family protein n=1 Tax=Escherichia coli TaxID=562 RepID=A0A484X5P9_ECOLX|nr:SirA family protein [Escherichia coli]
MKNIVPDYRLDMVGEPCPYPAVATLEAMPQLKKGEILEVVSDCPQSINNIPLMRVITAIRCWIFSKTGRPFVI